MERSDEGIDIPLTPLCYKIIRTIRERIGAGEYPPGFVLPSETALAVELQVSRGTLRKVIDYLLRHGDLVHGSGKHKSVPVKNHHNSVTSVSRTVYFWAYNPRDPVVLEAKAGLREVLELAGFSFEFAGPEGSAAWLPTDHREATFIEQAVLSQDCAGLIIWRDNRDQAAEAYTRLRQSGLPCVFLDVPPPPGFEADFVGPAHHRSAEILVELLFKMGHRRIACAWHGVPHFLPVGQRVVGYREAMRQLGLGEFICVLAPHVPYMPNFIDDGPTNNWIAEQKVLALELLEQALEVSPPPTVLISAYETSAQFMLWAAERRRLEVPDDLSIAGFGVKRNVVSLGHAEPTGVSIDYTEIGRRTAKQLLRRIRGQAPSYAESIGIPPQTFDGGTVRWL